ncbi:MAG TPA: winged helix-turn-helix domain-containing protein, partial [Acidobacteriota bacterium]
MRKVPHRYEFGPYLLDPGEHALLRGAEIVPLTPKAFDLLLVLVERQGRLVEKDELLKVVWPDSFVEEANL